MLVDGSSGNLTDCNYKLRSSHHDPIKDFHGSGEPIADQGKSSSTTMATTILLPRDDEDATTTAIY